VGVGSGVSRISKPSTIGNGIKLPKGGDVQARLDRLELPPPSNTREEIVEHKPESQLSPSSNSQTSQSAGISSDNHDGTLFVDGEQSQFVSSLHYALLAEEVCKVSSFNFMLYISF
jgi:hypothetical protein